MFFKLIEEIRGRECTDEIIFSLIRKPEESPKRLTPCVPSVQGKWRTSSHKIASSEERPNWFLAPRGVRLFGGLRLRQTGQELPHALLLQGRLAGVPDVVFVVERLGTDDTCLLGRPERDGVITGWFCLALSHFSVHPILTCTELVPLSSISFNSIKTKFDFVTPCE